MSAIVDELAAQQRSILIKAIENERKALENERKLKLEAEKATEKAKREAEEMLRKLRDKDQQSIKNLLLNNVSEEVIISSFGLSQEELDKIKKELN